MAYEYENELEDELGELGEMEGESEDESGLEGEGWLSTIGNIAGGLFGESEDEDEAEVESEDEINPIRKIYPDAMMEHLGELAAESESEDEAVEHFLPLIGMAAGKLLPLAAKALAPAARKALPYIARTITKVAPRLTKGVTQVTRALHRNPTTRHLLRAVPGIARRTVGQIARHVAHGRPVTPRYAARTLARQARRVLGSPQHRAHALRRHHRLERHFHNRWGRGLTPHQYWRWGRGYRRGGTPGQPPPTPVHGTPRSYGPRPAYGTYVQPGRPAPAPRAVGGCTCGAGGAPQYCRCCGQVLR
jgi:hypothetical protein